MNKFINNKGSTLVMLLIIVSILMILGTTIITLAITNYRVKSINSEVKYAFYYAEGALEESVIVANKVAYDAVRSANIKVDEESEKDKDKDKDKDEDKDEDINVDSIFETEYKNYIINIIQTKLLDNNNYKYFNENISVEVTKNYDLNYTIKVTYTDKVVKSLSHDIDIITPNYGDVNNNLVGVSNFKIIR